MDRTTARKNAETIVSKMTLEEKISQLRYDSPAIDRLGIPSYNWWNEALHGVARAGVSTMFPQAIGMAASFDAPLMHKVGNCIAEEGRAKFNMQTAHGDRDIYKGITFWAPNVNIFRDPRWGRGHETYGEDPYLTSRLAVSFIQGMQGSSTYMKVAACAKHFAVHSGPEADRHHFNAIVSRKDMEETYLPAFEACVKEGRVEAVMGAYNRTNGEVCCGSPSLQHILRDEWRFEGHFVSDCWAIADFHLHHKVTNTPEESAVLALENGTDLNCGCTYQKLLRACQSGMLDERYITESAIRLFTTRFLLGMFDHTEFDSIPFSTVESPSHLALEDQAAKESFVLLKNNGILPLTLSKIKNIAVIGPNANSRRALMGNYHGDASRYITVLEGIQDYVRQQGSEDIRILYSQGCDLSLDNVEAQSEPTNCDRMAEAQACAEISDLIIVVLGMDETLEGEEGDTGNRYASGDKKDLNLPFQQLELLRGMINTHKPVIVINMTGSAVDLSLAQEYCDAILQVWYPGARGGKNIAEILFGDASPSGKLPVTFYQDDHDLPAFEDYSMKGRTYRYYDGIPLYPFGYGLTYGDNVVEELTIRKDLNPIQQEPAPTDSWMHGSCHSKGPGHTAFGSSDDFASELGCFGVDVTVTVMNHNKTSEDDVLEIYVRGEDDPWAVPHPCLAAFKRVSIKPGMLQTFSLHLDPRVFSSVDDNGDRKIRGKKFTVYAGFSQPDKRSAELTGHLCIQKTIEFPD